ncbi:helix-turn-helix domain-containing protein [Streptomyces orinoci]|uniref:Helix-turn-helix transcriptional regulator n=1 Tax=Streptomyces orinoci TaxID=67339 RepID=A0ABV3K153_STRON|nr:helix-turn-helix transcriptional regulator [Streptomyces orinoci]
MNGQNGLECIDGLEQAIQPRSAQELFARRLRRLRERRGLTQQALGGLVPISQARICRFESGKELPSEEVVQRLDEVLDADGELTDIWPMAARRPYAALVRSYREAEEKAERIYHFANMIPGIAQVEGYARVIITEWNSLVGGLDVEESVQHRLERQSILDGPNAPWLWSVLDEVALRRVVGSPAIMRQQLQHLLDLGTRPRVAIQILPFRQAIPGGFTSTVLSLLSLSDGHQVAYQESGLNSSFATSLEEVGVYTTFYDHVQARALPPDESAEYIRTAIKEYQ